jgi:hypothetical protein
MTFDIVVGKVTTLRAREARNLVLIPGKGKSFYSPPKRPDRLCGPPSFLFRVEGALSPGMMLKSRLFLEQSFAVRKSTPAISPVPSGGAMWKLCLYNDEISVKTFL